MTQREVTDNDNTTWTCVQAYGNLSKENADKAAELTEDSNGEVTVVCTPSGGAQTVRLQLAKGWMEAVSDEELVSQIGSSQS
ncbi:hypothetical protein H9Q13_00725 [Pontibacter sp. JH31]|uniref:Uncharacterized protein n=1 Tax=Pontibacter aquaedesilientis TaxID=2766980 RepID=A0ABR7XBL6_9BACT|nr:hypothetical protein [Pontibacter aquaedesilientis]MBD1395675.1 hypothetical protein [Pontibacter aquaedesilientis]